MCTRPIRQKNRFTSFVDKARLYSDEADALDRLRVSAAFKFYLVISWPLARAIADRDGFPMSIFLHSQQEPTIHRDDDGANSPRPPARSGAERFTS